MSGHFCPVCIGLDAPRLEVQLVDIGLALTASLDRQQSCRLKRFEVAANTALVQAHVGREALLAWKAVVVLPSIAEQHGEGHLVTCAQLARSEQEVRYLRKPALTGGICAFEDDVFVAEEFPDMRYAPDKWIVHVELLYGLPTIGAVVIPYPSRTVER